MRRNAERRLPPAYDNSKLELHAYLKFNLVRLIPVIGQAVRIPEIADFLN